MEHKDIRNTDIATMNTDDLIILSSLLEDDLSYNDVVIYRYELQIKTYEHQLLTLDPESDEFEDIFQSLLSIKHDMQKETREREITNRKYMRVEAHLKEHFKKEGVI